MIKRNQPSPNARMTELAGNVDGIHILSPNLVGGEGHEAHYNWGLSQAAHLRNFAVSISAPVTTKRDLGLVDTSAMRRYWFPRARSATSSDFWSRLNGRLRCSLRDGMIRHAIASTPPGHLTFVHSAGFRDLLTAAKAAKASKRRVALMYRYDHYDKPDAMEALKAAALGAGWARFCTDSSLLAEMFNSLTGLDFEILPPPVPTATPAGEDSRSRTAPVFGYFGGARPSKGYLELPRLLKLIKMDAPTAKFLVQSYRHSDDAGSKSDRELASTEKQLQSLEGVEIVKGVLSTSSYFEAIDTTDVIALPYDPLIYRAVTSGVFVEAVCRNKCALVPIGSWMDEEARRHDLGKVFAVNFADDESVRLGVQLALAAIAKKASTEDRRWSARHSYETILDGLLKIAR